MYICIHINICLLQAIQQGFSLGRSICQKRHVSCVVCDRNSLCRVPSTSRLFFFLV